MIDVEATTEALHDLRRARRQNRLADVHWIDALYRVYMVGLVGVILIMLASGQLPDDKVNAAEADDLRQRGTDVARAPLRRRRRHRPALGGRGGPLVLEAPVVMYELDVLVPRAEVVRGPAIKQLASWPSPERSLGPWSASSPPVGCP